MTEEIRTVRWKDSSLQNGQVDKYAFPKPEVILTVGFVVEETDEYVTVARDDMGNGDYRGLCCIPKLSILPPTSCAPQAASAAEERNL